MSKSYQPAPDEVNDAITRVIGECYPVLTELLNRRIPLKIDAIFVRSELAPDGTPVGPSLKLHGVDAAAIVKIVGIKDRAMGRGDAEIQFDGHWWDKHDEDECDALIDHELCHLVPVRTHEGVVCTDDLGRVRLKIRPHDHDYGWFDEVARRRGRASSEVQQARRFYEENGQFYLGFPGIFKAA